MIMTIVRTASTNLWPNEKMFGWIYLAIWEELKIMTEEEKRELFLILDYYLIYIKKTGQTIVGGRVEDFDKVLQDFITFINIK